MNRSQLEHALRAAASVMGDKEFIVIGSQSILGRHADAPRSLRHSMEVDLIPKENPTPEKADLIAGSLGNLSQFHKTHGFYIDGCEPETAILPSGWEGRLFRVQNENTNNICGCCLHPVDLAFSKLYAAREKGLEFVEELLGHYCVRHSEIKARINEEVRNEVKKKVSENYERVKGRQSNKKGV